MESTWSLSFQQVEQRSAAAADLLRVCAYLSPDAIPEEIITSGASRLGDHLQAVVEEQGQLDEAIGVLRAYSFIRRDTTRNILSVHRLVQAVIYDALDESDRQCWAERAIRAVSAALPAVEHANWSQWERMLAHALACAGWIEREGVHLQEAAELQQQTGWYLTERARYNEAEPLLKWAYQLSTQEQGAEHLDTARKASTLASLYLAQGKYAQAEPLFQRALVIREQQLGPLHPFTAASLGNLAELYRAQGKYEQAEPLLVRVLSIYEQQLGPLHPLTATGLNNLASLYWALGKYEQAEPLLKRALVICEKVLGPEHPDTAQSLNNLGSLYWALGKYEQAEPLYQRAFAIDEKVLGPKHPNTQSVRKNYASLLRAMGRDAEAASLEANPTSPSSHPQ